MASTPDDLAPPRYLLLVPWPSKLDNLHDVYHKTLSTALKAVVLRPNRSNKRACLQVGVTVPNAMLSVQQAQRFAFEPVQRAIARFYSLLHAISMEQGADTVGDGGVDFLVLPLSSGGQQSSEEGAQPTFVSLAEIARSHVSWDFIYSADEPSLEILLSSFRVESQHSQNFGVERLENIDCEISNANAPNYQNTNHHDVVALGGTFDHLHAGHKLLLTMAAYVVQASAISLPKHRRIVVGISGDNLLKKKKYAEYMETWDVRQKHTFQFLRGLLDHRPKDERTLSVEEKSVASGGDRSIVYKLSPFLTVEFVQLQDPYGPTIHAASITALVISADTLKGGSAVNEMRAEMSWPPLELFEVDVLGPNGASFSSKDKIDSTQLEESKISSSEIRKNLKMRAEI